MYKHIAILFLAGLVLSACTTPSAPSSFYYLTALETEAQYQNTLDDLILGVGPLRLPGYIDRTQIIQQVDSNELKVNEFNRWGGDLEGNIANVIAENLSRRMNTDKVITYPWGRNIPVAYQVAIDIRRFDADENQNIQLIAQWRLFSGERDKLLQIKREQIIEPIQGQGFNAVATAQSRALVKLTRSISSTIVALQKQ